MVNRTEELADLVVGTTFDDLPDDVVQRTKSILLDALGCAIVGRLADETGRVERAARAILGEGTATVIAAPASLSPVGAVFVNSYQVTAMTICDVYRPAVYHTSPEVVPPALAAAEAGAAGRDLLLAIALGLEVSVRLAGAVPYGNFRSRGWHSPGVFGPLAGAVAAGRLMGLDRLSMRHALGLAGSQAAGTFASFGTPAIKFHQARGALSAHLAAALAAEGFAGATDILGSSDGGLFRTYADVADTAAVTAGWGERWLLHGIALKRWPAVTALQTMLTAMFGLLERHPIEPRDVERLDVALPPAFHARYGDVGWETPFLAKISPRYLASVVMHDRRCWLEQFTANRLVAPDVDGFARDRVRMAADPDLDDLAATISVRLRDGAVLTERRTVPKGEPQDPLAPEEVTEKFRDACRGVVPEATAEGITTTVRDLERVEDAAQLVALLRSST